jgi:hypothetical protein
MVAGRPAYGRITPETVVRMFQAWPARRAWHGMAWHGMAWHGIAGPVKTLGSPWPPLAMRPWPDSVVQTVISGKNLRDEFSRKI